MYNNSEINANKNSHSKNLLIKTEGISQRTLRYLRDLMQKRYQNVDFSINTLDRNYKYFLETQFPNLNSDRLQIHFFIMCDPEVSPSGSHVGILVYNPLTKKNIM